MMKLPTQQARAIAEGMRPPDGCSLAYASVAWLAGVLDPAHALPPGGEARPGARSEVIGYMRDRLPQEIDAPTVVVGNGGKLAKFSDGRHRWHILRDSGAEWCLIAVAPAVRAWLWRTGNARPYEIGGPQNTVAA